MAKKPSSEHLVFATTDKYNRHDENGHEVLNPTPMQPPLGYKPTPSLAETIRQQVRQMQHLTDTEPETEEEADDFEIDEDPQPQSRWENDMIPSIKETRKRMREIEEEARLYANPAGVGAAVADPSPPQAATPSDNGAENSPGASHK